METVYRNSHGRGARAHTSYGRRAKSTLGVTEKRRLAQLAVCVALFLIVIIGKGVFPERVNAVREGLTQIIGMDTDFRAAFANLGRAISKGEPVINTLGDLWIEVFGGQRSSAAPPTVKLLPSYEAECTFLNGRVAVKDLLARRLGEIPKAEPMPSPTQTPEPSPAPEPPPPVETAPTPETKVVKAGNEGLALPANATMDKYTLGLGKTVSPVSGWWLSSAFGWREHPVDGGEKFHNGIDMAVDVGTPVRAFAGGTVDYIGESPIYGLYTQIRHDNGVTTFYCHCSKLLVQKGKKVAAGDKIALAGETGNAVGAHLHFEVKKDGIFLNPSYYVKPE